MRTLHHLSTNRAVSRGLRPRLTLLAALAAVSTAHATPYYWLGGNSYNWGGAFSPSNPVSSSTTDLFFGANASGGVVQDTDGLTNNELADDFLLHSLNFANQAWTITGRSLRFASGGTVASAGYANTISNAASLDGAFTASVVSSMLTLTGILSDTRTAVSGTTSVGSLVKTGAGTLILSGANTYTGGTTIKGGTVQANAGNVLGTGDLTLAGGSLNLNGHAVAVGNLKIGDGNTQGSLGTVSGAGALNLMGNLSYQGALTGRFSNVVTVSAGLVLSSGQHTFGLVGNARSVDDYYDVILSGGISGPGGLNLASGRFALTAASTYAGATNVNGGTLYLTVPNALPANTALALSGTLVLGTSAQNSDGPSNGDPIAITTVTQTLGALSGSGILDIDGGNTLTLAQGAASLAFPGVIQGLGSFVKTGSGTLAVRILATANVTNAAGRLVVDQTNATNYANDGILELTGNSDSNPQYVGGVISGKGSVITEGTHEFDFPGQNTYTGGTTVQSGKLAVLYPNGSYVDNGTLEFDPVSNLTYATPITGTGAFVKGNSTTLTLSSANAYTGGTSVANGILRAGIDDPLGPGDLALGGGTLDLNGHTVSIRDLSLDNVQAYSSSGGTVSGTGSLGLAGNVTLNAPAPLNGQFGPAVTIGANIALSAGQHAIGSSGRITNRNNAADDDLTFSGVLSGPGGLTVTNGNLAVGLSGHSTYMGGTDIQQGEIDLLTADALPTTTALSVGTRSLGVLGVLHSQTVGAFSGGPAGDVELASGAVLTVGDATDTAYAGFFGEGSLNSGSLVKQGTGTLTLADQGGYTGGTTVQGGRLVVDRPIGSYLDNATLEFANATDLTYATPITGTGAFAKSGTGTLILTGMETYAGGTTVSGGRLQVGQGGNVGGDLTVAPGATSANAAGEVLTFGAGTLNGTVDTDASSSTVFKGLVTGGGSFTGKGLVEFDGGYRPGNPLASVSFGGDLALGLTRTLTMDLGGTTLGTGYDHLDVAETAYLGGTLDVVYANGFMAGAGQSFDLFDFARTFDRFSLVNLPTLASGLSWDSSALYTTGVIRVVPQAVPEPAAWAVLGIGALGILRRRRI